MWHIVSGVCDAKDKRRGKQQAGVRGCGEHRRRKSCRSRKQSDRRQGACVRRMTIDPKPHDAISDGVGYQSNEKHETG